MAGVFIDDNQTNKWLPQNQANAMAVLMIYIIRKLKL